MIKKYVKKPLVIEALLWDGENHEEMYGFLEGGELTYTTDYGKNFYIDHERVNGGLVIKTSEGDMLARIGDYIIKEPFDKERMFYPCKPDAFHLTYEEVTDGSL